MSHVDIDHLRQWVGREALARDVLSVGHARLMAATLGLPQGDVVEGAPLPPLWHWVYFLEGSPPQELGRDGHPARGGFLPPVPLDNRMWAGGTVEFHEDLPLGAAVEKRSRIASVDHKQGRSGDLVFVTVLHEVFHRGRCAITETHDIVYKNASASRPAPVELPEGAHVRPFTPTSTTLFRYSALTFNGHRIHYDADYCREVEGYPDLVVHGPLNATVLASMAQEVQGSSLQKFNYRGIKPSTLGIPLTVHATPRDDGMLVWIGWPDGSVSMQATAHFKPRA